MKIVGKCYLSTANLFVIVSTFVLPRSSFLCSLQLFMFYKQFFSFIKRFSYSVSSPVCLDMINFCFCSRNGVCKDWKHVIEIFRTRIKKFKIQALFHKVISFPSLADSLINSVYAIECVILCVCVLVGLFEPQVILFWSGQLFLKKRNE